MLHNSQCKCRNPTKLPTLNKLLCKLIKSNFANKVYCYVWEVWRKKNFSQNAPEALADFLGSYEVNRLRAKYLIFYVTELFWFLVLLNASHAVIFTSFGNLGPSNIRARLKRCNCKNTKTELVTFTPPPPRAAQARVEGVDGRADWSAWEYCCCCCICVFPIRMLFCQPGMGLGSTAWAAWAWAAWRGRPPRRRQTFFSFFFFLCLSFYDSVRESASCSRTRPAVIRKLTSF